MKGQRRTSRAHALQMLYQLDMDASLGLQKGLDNFHTHFVSDSQEFEFFERLVRGVFENVISIDKKIQDAATNWRVDRMSVVDRNILRLGVFELGHCDDIPATVTINEMVELAKEFGEDNSGAFINAILDKVRIRYPVSNKAP